MFFDLLSILLIFLLNLLLLNIIPHLDLLKYSCSFNRLQKLSFLLNKYLNRISFMIHLNYFFYYEYYFDFFIIFNLFLFLLVILHQMICHFVLLHLSHLNRSYLISLFIHSQLLHVHLENRLWFFSLNFLLENHHRIHKFQWLHLIRLCHSLYNYNILFYFNSIVCSMIFYGGIW